MYDDEQPMLDLVEAMCIFAMIKEWDVLSVKVKKDGNIRKEFRLFHKDADCNSELYPSIGTKHEHILNPGYIDGN